MEKQKLYTSKQAGEFLSVNDSSVRRWVREGKINAIKTPGGHNRITETEVQKILTLGILREEEQGHCDDIADIDRQIAEMEEKINQLKGGK